MNPGYEPVILVVPAGRPAGRRAALADVLVLSGDDRPIEARCARRFAGYPGLTLVVVCPGNGLILIGVRDGTLLILRDRHDWHGSYDDQDARRRQNGHNGQHGHRGQRRHRRQHGHNGQRRHRRQHGHDGQRRHRGQRGHDGQHGHRRQHGHDGQHGHRRQHGHDGQHGHRRQHGYDGTGRAEPINTGTEIPPAWSRPCAAASLAYSIWAGGIGAGSVAARLLARSAGFRLSTRRWRA